MRMRTSEKGSYKKIGGANDTMSGRSNSGHGR